MIHRLTAPAPPVDVVTFDLGEDVLEIRAATGGDAHLLSGSGRPARLQVVDVGDAAVHVVPEGGRRLVYADRFGPEDLAVLRDRTWCGIDRTGQLVLSTRPVVVTVERPGPPRGRPLRGDDTVRTVRGRSAEQHVTAVRGAVTARLTQLILESPGRRWRPSDLAAEDGRATIATASRLLAELRRLGLCTVVATRQSRLYSVADPELLLGWLADRTPPIDRRHTLDGYLRVEDIDKLIGRVVAGLVRRKVPAVFTGSTAAFVEDRPVTTTVALVTVRIDPAYDLRTVADQLGLEPGGRAGNVRLISDRGYVGTARPRSVSHRSPGPARRARSAPLAGVVRTWLDLRQERRGDDAAELYYERVLSAINHNGAPS